MGITGLIPFLEKASRRTNVDEFRGCTVAIDSYCWLHKGAFACAERLVRGEDTDIHIRYCLKYVTMLLSRNIKPILVFDGRHLPAKAMTEAKRRESRNISKKRAAELLSLGQTEEARSYMRRSVDITHKMALDLIKECRRRNVDCIVAPYEADAQLAYLNIRNIAHLVITEDSDLILFGCTKVLFKMDLDGTGTLVETAKLPLAMKCPIERYTFDKFRQMCIMSGCDYLASLPGIGLVKARQFVTATQDSNFANALKKLPSFFNKANLTVTDEYRENFLKAEATFKHQYVYDPIDRRMVRLTEPDDEDVETALCVNAGAVLDPDTAFQLALGNLDPFSLKEMDDWHPDRRNVTANNNIKSDSWKDCAVAPHPSMWSEDFNVHLQVEQPWLKKIKKPEPIIAIPATRARKKVVNLVSKYVPETQDESLSIETLSHMYCVEPASKKQKINDTHNLKSADSQEEISPLDKGMIEETNLDETKPKIKEKSPILENKERSFAKCLKTSNSISKRLSKFPRTVLGDNVVESKFFSPPASNSNSEQNSDKEEEIFNADTKKPLVIDTQCYEIPDSQPDSGFSSSQKENSLNISPSMKCIKSPILDPSPRSRNPFRIRPLLQLVGCGDVSLSQDSVIENTYPMENLVTPVDSQESFADSDTFVPEQIPGVAGVWKCKEDITCEPDLSDMFADNTDTVSSQPAKKIAPKKPTCKVPGLKKTVPLPSNQPTLLSKFGFLKRPVMKK